jgi:hypothetical protein
MLYLPCYVGNLQFLFASEDEKMYILVISAVES